jgi:hypothetical protein
MAKRTKDPLFNYIDYLNQFYISHKDSYIDLIYEGEISHEITKSFTSLIEGVLEKRDELRSTKKKIFNVMVECLQNIDKHADNSYHGKLHQHGKGLIIISNDDKDYTIVTGNVVENDKMTSLKNSVDKVNGLEKQDLRELYKKQLSEGRLSEKGGAGLGFIDIARKSGQNISYSFFSIDKLFSFFVLTVRVSKT